MDLSQTYSVENGVRFGWSSLTGTLNPERVQHLQRYLVGKTILDAGCGGGAFVEYLCRSGFQVTGLDYHAFFLDLARAQSTSMGTYVQGDITAISFPDRNFDCAFCYDVLEHVDDKQALKELVRVAKRRVILAVPATDGNVLGFGMTFRHYQDLTHLRTYTRESLEALFHEIGLTRYQIFPELAVDLKSAAINHLDTAEIKSPLRAAVQGLYHRLVRRLLARARYRIVHSGWMAVIDLENDSSTSAP